MKISNAAQQRAHEETEPSTWRGERIHQIIPATKVGQLREQSTGGFAAMTIDVDRTLERYCCA
jgi:hypothetical protein